MHPFEVVGWMSAGGLIAVWGLYPLAMGLLAGLRRSHSEAPKTGTAVRVSVVIATRDEAAVVEARVRDLLGTDYPRDRLEIIVSHDRGSNPPDLAGLATEGSIVRAVAADEGGGKAAALNAGVREATGDVIVFADTHQRFDAETIPLLVSTVLQPGVGAVTGRYSLAEGSGTIVGLYWRFERWLRRMEAKVHSSIGATGAVYAIRRSLWQPLPVGLILDDVYTPMRIVLAGYRVAFAEDARARETRTPSPLQEYGRKVRTLTGVLQLCAWLPGVLNPVRNPVWIQFMFHKLLRLLTPYCVLGILLWLLVEVSVFLGTSALILGSVFLATALWTALSPSRQGGRMRRLISEAVLLQLAVLKAGFNGLRGHWRVWDV